MSLLDTGTLDWSQDFWSTWLNDSTTPVQNGIDHANARGHHFSGNMVTYEDTSLTCGQ
jgi:hypothetical protein